jgi:dTDP-4-amino-4,6-dideoxygalactose transaminase
MMQIGVGGVFISEKAKDLVRDVLDSNRLTYGKYSKEFETRFAELHGCKFAVLSNSGTSSLQVALATLKEIHKWQDNDEVIVPATTFVASVNVIISNGLRPVLVDIDPIYYSLDPTKIERAITDRTRCIMVVHLFGQPCDMDPIMDIAKRFNLKVVEDSCETVCAKYKGKPVGQFGDISCFSTYTAHIIVTGVGGLSLTNDPEYAVVMRSLVNHGRNNIYITIDDDNNVGKEKLSEIIDKRFQFVRIGYSYRITELEAALGVAQLDTLSENIARRKDIANMYTDKLHKYRHMIQLPEIRLESEHVFMMYPIVIITDKFTKKQLTEYLEFRGIETRDMLPLVCQPIYKDIINEEFPVSENIIKNGFFIGSHPHIDDNGVQYIITAFSSFFDQLDV